MSYDPDHFDETETPEERAERIRQIQNDDGIRDLETETPGYGLRYMVYDSENASAWVVADSCDTVDVEAEV